VGEGPFLVCEYVNVASKEVNLLFFKKKTKKQRGRSVIQDDANFWQENTRRIKQKISKN